MLQQLTNSSIWSIIL